MNENGLDSGYRSKLIGLLDKVTTFSGNPVIQQMSISRNAATELPMRFKALAEGDLGGDL